MVWTSKLTFFFFGGGGGGGGGGILSALMKAHSKKMEKYEPLVCFDALRQVNSFGHGRTISSPNHNFFLGKLE